MYNKKFYYTTDLLYKETNVPGLKELYIKRLVNFPKYKNIN